MIGAVSTMWAVTVLLPLWASETELSQLMNRCVDNRRHLDSWILRCEGVQRFVEPSGAGDESVDVRHHQCDIRTDGKRVFWRWHRWGGPEGTKRFVPKDRANYLSMLWDGRSYSNYRTGGTNRKGILVISENPPPMEVRALQREHAVAPLMGYYRNTDERIDQVLRDARALSLRAESEDVNGVPCRVIEAQTNYGDYRVWIDPLHGHSVAKVEIRMSRASHHIYQGRPVQGDGVFTLNVLSFAQVDGIWVPMDGLWEYSRTLANGDLTKTTTRMTITDIVLDPDHESLNSFVRDDVKDGTWGWIEPFDHIKYTWQDGEFTPQFDRDLLARLDRILDGMANESTDCVFVSGDVREYPNADSVSYEPNTADVRARGRPGPQRPYCGLYCAYSILRLAARQADLRELIKPEYLGSRDGSSLMELRKAAVDHGLRAEPAARLSTRALRRCPYRAILHVRSHPESAKYDHYELFLGIENGKAKLFNPPEAPRLVSFADLATQWDGKALLVSDGPIELDVVLAPDRQRLLYYGMAAVLAILAAHFGTRLWGSVVPAIPRRWALCLTAGQVAALGLAALLCGAIYHFVGDTGLLANAVATQLLQKGYAASFIPKVRESRVHRLLGTDTVFVDARLARDYELGHLEGAVSLPIDANDAVWKATTEKIPRNAHIVAYCQSAGCKFVETVSLRLIEEGYSDISIFKGGWAEWVAKHGRPPLAESTGKEVRAEHAEQDDPA